MAARAWLIGLILGIPLLGFGISTAIRAHFDSEFRTTTLRRLSVADRTRLASLTVADVCRQSAPETRELCDTDANLAFMQSGSLATATVGVGLLVLIALAGSAARTSRDVMLVVFRPGLYVTALVITGLILAHALIAIAVIYYGESPGRWRPPS